MKKLLGKKLNKKGFTLAELLIAVAIIAILIAIALPLFFGSMDKAEEARDDANRRAVKAVVVNAILSDEKNQYAQFKMDESGLPIITGDKVVASFWMSTAFVSNDGEIYISDIIPYKMESNDGKNYDPNTLLKNYYGEDYKDGYVYKWFDKGSEVEGDEILRKPDSEGEEWINSHGGAWVYLFVLTSAEAFDEYTPTTPSPVEP